MKQPASTGAIASTAPPPLAANPPSGDMTHEHAATGKVFAYQFRYTVHDDRIDWSADLLDGTEVKSQLQGSIPVSSPGIAAVAEQAVRDAVVAQIDKIRE